MQLIEAFAWGCGGRVASALSPRLEAGDAVFYGVRKSFVHLLNQAKNEGRNYYIIDNSYFDRVREKQFRITKNAMQCDGLQASWTGEGAARLRALRITTQPWRECGEHIVICPQSPEYMELCGWRGDWLSDVKTELAKHTTRSLRVRMKGERKPLSEDLRGAWALVTHTSAAAVEALVAGVPVFCTGRCAAQWMGTGDLSAIETPVYPERREEWAAVLAENQWSIEEMRDGTAWSALCH